MFCLDCVLTVLMSFVYNNLLLIVLNIKTISLKCQKRKSQKRKSQKRKSLCLKRKLFPQLKVFLERPFLYLHVLLHESLFFFQLFSFCILNLYLHSFVFFKKIIKIAALSGRTVYEEKVSVAFHKEEVVRERTELEVVETPVEVLEEEEFHEVQEYFEEEEFHEVEEFIRVEKPRMEEVHRAEEVHRVIEFLETEEVEVYEKPKAPPKGIGEFCCYCKLLYSCSNSLFLSAFHVQFGILETHLLSKFKLWHALSMSCNYLMHRLMWSRD